MIGDGGLALPGVESVTQDWIDALGETARYVEWGTIPVSVVAEGPAAVTVTAINAVAGGVSTLATCEREGRRTFACGKSIATTALGAGVSTLLPGGTLPWRVGKAALSAGITWIGGLKL